MRIKKRRFLREKQRRQVLADLRRYLPEGVSFDEAKLEFVELEHSPISLVLVDGEPLVLMLESGAVPSLRCVLDTGLRWGEVVVDAGAVRHVVNGADIMAPGVVRADEDIVQGDVVYVKEEVHGKFLCVGEALVDGPFMRGDKGRVVKNIHHVGDGLWNLEF